MNLYTILLVELQYTPGTLYRSKFYIILFISGLVYVMTNNFDLSGLPTGF